MFEYYSPVKIEEQSGVTYILLSSPAKPYNWVVQKVDETTSPMTIMFATPKNNSSIPATDFNKAWNNRTTLNYSSYNEL